jgi:hypothetical protein
MMTDIDLPHPEGIMHRANRSSWTPMLVLAIACLFPASALAHPGSGIVVDRSGNVYVVDMVSGVWKLDVHRTLTHMPGPGFHWMTLDADDHFETTRLPSGSGGEIARIGAHPTLLLGSDVPISLGSDGNLYYPTHGSGIPLQIIRLLPSGRTSVVASIPAATASAPLRDLNGLAAGPAGSLYYTENRAIRRIDTDGRVTTVVDNLSCGGRRDAGRDPDPLLRGLDVDRLGIIYVAATGCRSVLKVTPAGDMTVLPQVSNAWSPTGVAVFGADLYVLEFEQGDSDDRRQMLPRIRKISADGTAVVATVARH